MNESEKEKIMAKKHKTIVMFTVSMLITGCSSDDSKLTPTVHTSHRSLDNMVLVLEETTINKQWDDWTTSTKLTAQFNKPGTYLLEGWVRCYRSPDQMVKEWSFTIDEPQKADVFQDLKIHRLEICHIQIIDNKPVIKKDRVGFGYKGISGSFNIQRQPSVN